MRESSSREESANQNRSGCLSDEFVAEYRKFCAEFDSLASDLFQGELLNQLASAFLSKHQQYIQRFPFAIKSAYPNCSNNETLDEDLRIVSDEDGDAAASQQDTAADLLGDLHRRACQARHLHTTYLKSRRQLECDRREAVELGRRALRYAPHSFEVNYWYMIAVGWQLDALTNTRERTMVACIFRQATRRCIRLNPRDPLAYNLLGRYYYSVAGLTWLEKTVAHRLLGYKLEGSYADSEREFRRALELKGDWLPSGLWLARVLLAQNKPMAEVRHWIEYGLQFESQEPTTEIERNELLELRSKLKLCSN